MWAYFSILHTPQQFVHDYFSDITLKAAFASHAQSPNIARLTARPVPVHLDSRLPFAPDC